MRSTLLIVAAAGALLGAAAGRWQLAELPWGHLAADQRLTFWAFFLALGLGAALVGGVIGGALAGFRGRAARGLAFVAGIGAAVAVFFWLVPRNVREMPPVFLLITDTTRADHLSLYGYERPTTPFLEELAGESIVFANAASQGSHTIVTTPCILASCYPTDHGIVDYRGVLDDRFVLLPEILAEAGYRTFGVYTNPHIDAKHGFGQGYEIYVSAGLGNHNAVLADTVHNRSLAIIDSLTAPPGAAFDSSAAVPTSEVAPAVAAGGGGAGGDSAGLSGGAVAPPVEPESSPALDPAADSAPADSAAAPLYGFLFYTDPHAPYQPPEEYRGLYDPDWEGEHTKQWNKVVRGVPDDRTLFNLIAQYDAAITYWDEDLRRFFTELEARGLRENALWIYTSDHGEEFYEHDDYGHGHALYQESVHVPLVVSFPVPIRWPPLSRTSRVVEEVVSSVDILPTVLEWLRLPVPEGVRGRSALEVALGGEDDPEDGERFAYLEEILERYGPYDLRALRTPDRKLILTLTYKTTVDARRSEFYDLEVDPGETADLFEERPDEAEEYQLRLGDLVNEIAVTAFEAGNQEALPDEEAMEALRALGYLE
jgi:arylsulfatase A-like enzyme